MSGIDDDLPNHRDSHGFPSRRSLCERCGYRLVGIDADGACPECGSAVDDSHPRHRTGPGWQNRMSPWTWLETAVSVGLHPRRTYRQMRLDGSNWPPRVFLLICATVCGVIWAVVEVVGLGRSSLEAWIIGMGVTDAVIVLAYIEAGGVTWFSGHRGWSMPWRVAERVACYASLGLLLAAVVLVIVRLLLSMSGLRRHLLQLTGQVGYLGPGMLLIVLLGVSVLGFEILVWTGARQVRYASGASS